MKPAWEECIRVYGKENIVIVSNSGMLLFDILFKTTAGTLDDIGYQHAHRITKSLGVPVLVHTIKKPEGAELLLDYFKIKNASSIGVIGDRILTDIVYGNSIGISRHLFIGSYTILTTKIIDIHGDNLFAILIRRLEHIFLPWLIKRHQKN